MKPIIIGIAGGSASGKTSIAKIVYDAFDDEKNVVIIRQDDYYKDQSHLTMEERVLTNYDHPLAFDNDLLIHDLQQLLNRQTIKKPIYDFVHHTRSETYEIIQPCDVIILEGLFVLEDEKLRDLFNPNKFMVKITPIHITNACKENNIETSNGYFDYTPYRQIENNLKNVGFDVLVFIPSIEEDTSRITCGNAILSDEKNTSNNIQKELISVQ